MRAGGWRVIMVVAPFVAVCAGGCSSLNLNQGSNDRLQEALMYYHAHLRAGDIDQAGAYVGQEAYEQFAALHDQKRSQMRIEEFTIQSVNPDSKSSRAIVIVDAETRNASSITMKTVRFREEWLNRMEGWRMVKEDMVVPKPGP